MEREFVPDVEVEHEIDPVLIEGASKIIGKYLEISKDPDFNDALSLINREYDISDTLIRVKKTITDRTRVIFEQKLMEKKLKGKEKNKDNG